MFSIAHLKNRFSQYAALWVAGFLASGVAIALGLFLADLMVVADRVLPVGLALVTLVLGAGLVASWLGKTSLGTKLLVTVAGLLLLLPLLWAPVSAAVVIAFILDRSIEYSEAYASFQIGVAQILYPLTEWLMGGALFSVIWQAFQLFASVVGVISAFVRAWPFIRRLLGPEPVVEA